MRSRPQSERGLAATIAAAYANIDWHIVAPAPAPTSAELDVDAEFRVTGVPRIGSQAAWLGSVVTRARELGSSVLLAADAGNLTLSYDGLQYLNELLSHGQLPELWREVRSTSRYLRWSPFELLRDRIRPLVPPGLAGLRRWSWRSVSRPYAAINPSLAKRLALGRNSWAPRRWHDTRSIRETLFAPAEFRQANAAVRLLKGVEVRDPLGDRRMFDFCLSLHPTTFLRQGTTRWLARRVLADRVSPEVLANRHRVPQHPEWFVSLSARRKALAESFDAIESSPLCRLVLDLPRLQSLLRDFPDTQPTTIAGVQAYRRALPRALHLGRFIRWVESGRH